MSKFSVGQIVWVCEGVGRELKSFSVAESESLHISKNKASNHLAKASEHLLLAMKCKVHKEEFVQSTYYKRFDIVMETIREINYDYCG